LGCEDGRGIELEGNSTGIDVAMGVERRRSSTIRIRRVEGLGGKHEILVKVLKTCCFLVNAKDSQY